MFVNYIVNIVLLEYTYAELCNLIPSTNRTARVWTRFFCEVWSCHILHGSAIPVLTATGLVNGRWQFSNPHWIHTKNLVHFWLRRRSLRLCQIWCKSVLGGFWANEWNITKIFFIIYLYLFQELTYRTDPSADFHARWLQQHELMQGCTFLGGFIDIAPRFLGWNTPKTPILWAWMDVVTTGSKCSHRKRIPRGTEWQSQWPCMTVVSPASCRTNLLH